MPKLTQQDRKILRTSMRLSYVGHADDDLDYVYAARHGTTYVREFAYGPGGPERNHYCFGVIYWNQGSVQFEEDTMTLLIPDRDRENREDFIWCVPIERQKWNKWFALSEQFKCVTPDIHGGVRYMNRMEGKQVKTVLMMPTFDQSDDDVLLACAYLRMIKQMTCRMYVVRCTDLPMNGPRIINAVAGANPDFMDELEDMTVPNATK